MAVNIVRKSKDEDEEEKRKQLLAQMQENSQARKNAEIQAVKNSNVKFNNPYVGGGTYLAGKYVAGLGEGTTNIVSAPMQTLALGFQQGSKQASKEQTTWDKIKNIGKNTFKTFAYADPTMITRLMYDTTVGRDEFIQNANEVNAQIQQNASQADSTWKKATAYLGGYGSFIQKQYLNSGLNQLQTGAQSVGQVLGSEKSQQASQALLQADDKLHEPIDKLNEELSKSEGSQNKVIRRLGNASYTIGNMTPSILISALSGGAGASDATREALSLTTMGISAKGGSTREGLKQGLDLSTAERIGVSKGMVEVGTEKMWNGLSFLKSPDSKVGSAIRTWIGKQVEDRIKSQFGKTVLTKWIPDLAGETLEEFVSGIYDNWLDRATVDPNRGSFFKEQSLDTLIDTTLSTLLMNAPSYVLETKAIHDRNKGGNQTNVNTEESNGYKQNLQEMVNNLDIPNEMKAELQQTIDSNETITGEEYNNTKERIKSLVKQNTQQQIDSLSNNLNNQYIDIGNRLSELDTLKQDGYQEGRESRKIFAQQLNANFDDPAFNTILGAYPENRNGRRTIGQYKEIAKAYGQQMALDGLSVDEVRRNAVSSFIELKPAKRENITRYDNRTKSNQSYERMKDVIWTKTVYDSYKDTMRTQLQQQQEALSTQMNDELARLQDEENILIDTIDNLKPRIEAVKSSLVQSAEQYGYKGKQISEIQDLMKRRGINAYFDETQFNNDSEGAFYNPKTNEIVFNPNASQDQVIQELAVHEWYHDLVAKGQGSEIQQSVIDFLKNNKDYQDLRKSLENAYAKLTDPNTGEYLYDIESKEFSDMIDEEATAKTLQRVLGNETEIQRLINYKPSLARRIYDAVVDLLNKFTGGRIEKLYWQDVRNKFEAAFNENGISTNEGTTRYSVKENRQYLEKQFEELTGDSVLKADARLAGREVRNRQRQAGNLEGEMEALPYSEEAMDLYNKIKSSAKSSNYLYHSTPADRLQSIIENGLTIGNKQNQEGVSSTNKLYLSASEELANSFTPDDSITFRINPNAKLENLDSDLLGGEGAYTITNNIPPEMLQVKENGKWVRLDKSELAKTNSTQIKATDNQGRTLTKEQQEYFKDSKARDKNGNLLEVYHGTNNEFTVFDKSYLGTASGDLGFLGDGFYLATHKGEAGYYGSDVMSGYVNLENPFNIKDLYKYNNEYIAGEDTSVGLEIANLVKMNEQWGDITTNGYSYKEIADETENFLNNVEIKRLGDVVDSSDNITGTMWQVSYNGNNYETESIPSYKQNEILADALNKHIRDNFGYLRSNEIIQNITSSNIYDKNIKSLSEVLQENGYDGIVQGTPQTTDEIVIFNSNQFKNIDNKTPTTNSDIRYSVNTDNQGNKINPGMQEYLKDVSPEELVDGKVPLVYHTTTDKGLPFFEFDPTGTKYYRFGDQVVNYYTDSQDMSSSYANSDYTKADTTRIDNIEQAKNWLKDNTNSEDNIDVKATKKGDKRGNYVLSHNGEAVLWFDELRELPRAVANYVHVFKDISKLKTEDTGYERKQFEGYVKLTNPYVIDAEQRNWNQVVSQSNDFIDELTETVSEEAINNLTRLYRESQDISAELRNDYNKYDRVIRDIDSPEVDLDYGYPEYGKDNDIRSMNHLLRRTSLEEVLLADNGDTNLSTNFWYSLADTLQEDGIIGKATYDNIIDDFKLPEQVKEWIHNQLYKDVNFRIDGVKNIKELYEKKDEAYRNFDKYRYENSYFKEKIMADESEEGYVDLGELNELLEERAETRGADVVADEIAQAASVGFSKPELIRLWGTSKTTNDIVKEVIASNQDGTTNYDGVIIKNVYDYGGKSEGETKPANVYVTFNSNQFKAKDNLNPTMDKDIRYSEDTNFDDWANNNLPSLGEGKTTLGDLRTEQRLPVKETKLPKTNKTQTISSTIEEPTLKVPVPKGETGTEQKVAKVLSEPITKVKPEQRAWALFKANILDKGAVFEDLSFKSKNRELQAKWDSTLLAEAKGQNAIGQARYEFENGEETQVSKALTDIIDEVGENSEDFNNYMYHQLNIDRMTLEDRFDIANKPVFGDGIDANYSRQKVAELEKAHPEFKEYAQDVYDYLDTNKKELVDNGVISQETSDRFKEMYPHYVPIARIDAKGLAINVPLDTNRTGVNSPIKRAKGGSQDIQPLFQTIADRTMQTYKASSRNSFGLELKNTLDNLGMFNQLETTTENADNENLFEYDGEKGNLTEGTKYQNPTFTVFENGEKVTYEINQDMYDALRPKNEIFSKWDNTKLMKTTRKINDIRRGILTEYNPAFSITNAIKDAQDVLMNSQHAGKTYAKFPEAYSQILKKGYWYKEYVQNGGSQNSYFTDGDFVKKDSKAKSIIKMPLEAISNINNVIEMSPRLAEYIASREQGKSIQSAMLDASRVTTNFKAGGDVTKFANRNGATFLNASVQGLQQNIRNIREANAKGLKGYGILLGKAVIASLPALILNNLVWKDDDDYEDLQDYVKDNYYIIAKIGDHKFLRIPKGRTVAVIQKAVTNMSDFLTNKDEIDPDKYSEVIWGDLKDTFELASNNLAPNNPIENNIISPLVQAVNNKTWYGEDLVPTRLQDKPNEEKYDESTAEISKQISGVLNKIGINTNPMQINYLLDQYGGGVSDVLLPMGTPQAENNMLEDKFTTDSVMKSRYPGEFFELKDKLAVNRNSSKATDEDELLYKYANSISGELSDLYKQKREIQNSSLTDKEKKKQIAEVQKQINSKTQQALKDIKEPKVKGDTATIGDSEFIKTLNANSGEYEWKKLTDKTKIQGVSLKTQADYQNRLAKYKQKTGDSSLTDKEEAQIIIDGNYTTQEKKAIYLSTAGKNDKLYSAANSNLNIDEYLGYKTANIQGVKDSNGKTISGSKKAAQLDYINNNISGYENRLLLMGKDYKLSRSQQQDLAEYIYTLDNADDLFAMYDKNFTVRDGTVYYK